MSHFGYVSLDDQRQHIAHCHCGWRREPTDSHKEAAYWALEHSDEETLRYIEYDARLTYPDATFEEIHGLYDIVDQEPVSD